MFGIFKKEEDHSEWIYSATRESLFTPDAGELQKYQYQLLFVYDNMMTGHPMHGCLGDRSLRLCTAFTQDKFAMVKKKVGKETFPIPLEGQSFHNTPNYRVKGELYAIRPYQYFTIDMEKLNGVSFYRRRIRLIIPYRRVVETRQRGVVTLSEYGQDQGRDSPLSVEGPVSHFLLVKAWMYIGIPDFWSDILDGGYLFGNVRHYQPNRFKPWLKRYYFFTKMEYKY